jgi:hypothetical protein
LDHLRCQGEHCAQYTEQQDRPDDASPISLHGRKAIAETDQRDARKGADKEHRIKKHERRASKRRWHDEEYCRTMLASLGVDSERRKGDEGGKCYQVNDDSDVQEPAAWPICCSILSVGILRHRRTRDVEIDSSITWELYLI